MQINDREGLARAIRELSKRSIIEENILLDNMYRIKLALDPVEQVNKLFSRKAPFAEAINNLLDESIVDGGNVLINKLTIDSTDSFLKETLNTFMQLSIAKTVNRNAYKIKAVSVVIIKNILRA